MYDGVIFPAEDAPALHPKLSELFGLWRGKLDGRVAPRRADITTFELAPWLGHLMLIEVVECGIDFHYRVYGTALANYFGRDLTGRKLSTLPEATRNVVAIEYRRAVAEARPVAVTHRRSVSRMRVPTSKLILPLGTAPGAIEHLLVGMYLAN